jgi:ankyrin repeat protein
MTLAKKPAVDPGKELLKAVKKGDSAQVAALLQSDPSLAQAREEDGSTPLHHAAWKGHAEVAVLLLDAGADVNARNENGHYGGTPLHAAAHGNQRAVAEVLIARGADLTAQSCNGRTPLEETTIHNATTVANLLKKHGAAG